MRRTINFSFLISLQKNYGKLINQLENLLKKPLVQLVVRAEEDTPKELFKFSTTGEVFIGIDPLNGTGRYIDRKKAWEIIISVYTKKKLLLSFPYMPVLDTMITVSEKCGICICPKTQCLPEKTPTDIILTKEEIIMKFSALREFFRGKTYTG